MVKVWVFLFVCWVNIFHLQWSSDVPNMDTVHNKYTTRAGTTQADFLSPTPHRFLPSECRHIPCVGSEQQIYHRLHLQREMKASLFSFFPQKENKGKTQKSPAWPVGPVLMNPLPWPHFAVQCKTLEEFVPACFATSTCMSLFPTLKS